MKSQSPLSMMPRKASIVCAPVMPHRFAHVIGDLDQGVGDDATSNGYNQVVRLHREVAMLNGGLVRQKVREET